MLSMLWVIGTLALWMLAATSVSSRGTDNRLLTPRTLETVGDSRFTSPNSNTLVVQCRPLDVTFTSPSAPKNLSILIALNDVPTPAAYWDFPAPPDNNWVDSSSVRTMTWPAVDARQGSIMWVEQHGWGGDVTYLLGDGISVQASTDSSCLGRPGSNPESNQFEGDPSHIVLGQTMVATITTTFRVPSGSSYSSHSITTSSERATRSSSNRPTTSPPSSSSSSSSVPPPLSSSSNLNVGALAGGAAAGGVALLSAIGLGVFFLFRRRSRRRNQEQLEKFGDGGSRDSEEDEDVIPARLMHVDGYGGDAEGGGVCGGVAGLEVEPWTYTAPSTTTPLMEDHRAVAAANALPPSESDTIQEVDAGPVDEATRIPPAYGSATSGSWNTAPPPSSLSDASTTSPPTFTSTTTKSRAG